LKGINSGSSPVEIRGVCSMFHLSATVRMRSETANFVVPHSGRITGLYKSEYFTFL
jgi:hypothetical protein